MHTASVQRWHAGDFIADHWEIQDVLRGGMGVVYVVRDLETGERLAAKTYRTDLLDRQAVSRFEREADVWLSLGAHDHIVTAKYFKIVESVPLLFLEYIDGIPLKIPVTPRFPRDRTSQVPTKYDLDYEQLEPVQTLAMQFCSGMVHARKSGLTAHRDVKPSNCLIDSRGSLKISDFGLAKIFDIQDLGGPAEKHRGKISEHHMSHAETPAGDTETLACLNVFVTHTGVGAGTAPYMAPEQFDDFKRADVRSDIYSFGVMLYQMVTGNLPFRGRTWAEYRDLHQTAMPPVLTTWFSDFNAIVARCLAKEPSDRFADFGELGDGLTRAIYDPYEDEYDEVRLAILAGLPRNLTEDETLLRAVSQAHLGHHDKALEMLDDLIEQNPACGAAWRESGRILLHQLHRFDDAFRSLSQAQGLGLDVDEEMRLCRERMA